MQYSFKEIVENTDHTISASNTKGLRDKAKVQLDRTLKRGFIKHFNFEIDFYDIKDGFMIIGSNFKNFHTDPQISISSSVYRYNIYNDSLIKFQNLESSDSIMFLVALEFQNSVLICYNNNHRVIFDYLKEEQIFTFSLPERISNVISEQGLNKIFFTTGFDLWEWNSLESLKLLKLKNLEAPIRCIEKIKDVNIFLFLTEEDQIKVYIHTIQQILEVPDLKEIRVNRFMFMKESQILILETWDNKFQIWKVQVDYPHFKQQFTKNLDSDDFDQFLRLNEGNFKSKKKNDKSDLEDIWFYEGDIDAFILDQMDKDENLIKMPSLQFPKKSEFFDSQKSNKNQDLMIDDFIQTNTHDENRAKSNDFQDIPDSYSSLPIKLQKINEFEINFKPILWDFCDSSNILFLTQNRENINDLYCCFTHNHDVTKPNILYESRSITGMKICQNSQLMILKSNSNNVRGLNLSRTGFHPFGQHEHIIDVFFDESIDILYTCGSNSIKKWNMSTHKCIQSKTLFQDGLTRVMSYQFCANKNLIFFSTNTNYIGFIDAPTLENLNLYWLNDNPIFENKNILIRINCENLSVIFAGQNSPDLHRFDVNNEDFHFKIISTNNKAISNFHISQKHGLIIVYFDESPEIQFYDTIKYQVLKRLQIFKPLPLNFIFENEQYNHLYIGVKNFILIIDLVSLEKIKQVPMNNTHGYQISGDYLLINCDYSTSVKIWNFKTLSLACKLNYFYYNGMRISICKVFANKLFVADKYHFVFQNFVSNNTQNTSLEIPFNNIIFKQIDLINLFDNHLLKYIFSKDEFQINSFNVPNNYEAILHKPNNNLLVVIYEMHFEVWQIETWKKISEKQINEGNIFYYTLFTDDPNKFLILEKSMNLYQLQVYQLLPFKLCNVARFVGELKIEKFIVNTKTQFAYFSDNTYMKVYQVDFNKSGSCVYTELYSSSNTINNIMISEKKNWLFMVMEDLITIVFDLNHNVVLKTIDDNNSLRKVILLDSKNIFVSMEIDGYMIWEVSTLRLIGKFQFTKDKQTRYMQSPQSSVKDIISIKIWEKNSAKFLSIHNYSEINNLSVSEEIFLANLFFKKSNPNQFVKSYREMKHIYESSLVLKNYFNIYLLAVMSDNEKTFETLFKKDKEPFEFNIDQINPLQLLLIENQNEKLNCVINFMIKNQIHMKISSNFFEFFLKKKENYVFDYLANSCTIINIYENTEEDIIFYPNLTQPITIINHPWPVYTQATHKLLIQSQENGKLVRMLNWLKGRACPKGIVIYDLNIEWDFTPYTKTSLDFLLAYHDSKYDNFILSPYRHIIFEKWNNLSFYFNSQAYINWAHIILYCLFLLETKTLSYFIADAILLFIIGCYEIFSFFANSTHYGHDLWNYVDITNFVLCFLLLFWNYFSNAPVYEMHWGLLILHHFSVVLVSIRGFSFFRFLRQLSHITTMSASMIKYSLSIIILIGYCILCLSVILTTTSLSDSLADKQNKNHAFISDLSIMYNLLFGNIPSEWPQMEEIRAIYIIIIVISSMILPIFFMNLLIAKLSSAYNTLEQRHLMISLKEMSFLIYEWEVLIQFFKYKIFRQKYYEKKESVFLVVDKKLLLASEKSTLDDGISKKIDVLLANQKKQMKVIDSIFESLNSKLK